MYSVCLLCKLASGLGAIWYRGSHKGTTPVVCVCMESLRVRSLGEWRWEQNLKLEALEPSTYGQVDGEITERKPVKSFWIAGCNDESNHCARKSVYH